MHRNLLAALALMIILGGAGEVSRVSGHPGVNHTAARPDRPLDLESDPLEVAGWMAEMTSAPSEQAGSRSCDQLLPQITKGGFTDPVFILSDAELVPGSSGRRLCVFWDNLLRSYGIWPINQVGVEEFRRMKAEMLPRLSEAGIEPCQVSFWAAVAQSGASGSRMQPGKMTLPNDWHDAGEVCEPAFVAHGPVAESRMELIRSTMAESAATAERVYGWRLTWPLIVHVYDDKEAYLDGLRADGGSEANRELSRRTSGMTLTHSNRMTTIAIDASPKDADDLRTTVAHEFGHVLQNGYAGCSCSLPQFVIEGGAEYFASLVLGAEQKSLSGRFQTAINDVQASRQRPLSGLVKDYGNPPPEAYSRGYAAMRYFESRWGRDELLRLHREAMDQTAEAFLQNMSRATGLTLDEFDRDLNGWLRGFGSLLPAPTPRPTPRPAATPRPNPTPRSATNPPATPPSPPPGPPTPP